MKNLFRGLKARKIEKLLAPYTGYKPARPAVSAEELLAPYAYKAAA
jgi:hypothetical protein